MNSMDAYDRIAQNFSDLYSDHRSGHLDTIVPWTPEWTARDVLAHVSSVATETAQGRLNGPPSPAESMRWVQDRRQTRTADLVDQLTAAADDLAAQSRRLGERPPTPTLAWDATVHLADVSEVWEVDERPDAWTAVLDESIQFLKVTGRLTRAVSTPDSSWGEGDPIRVDDSYELFRIMFGRRTVEQAQQAVSEGDAADLVSVAFFAS